MIFLLRSDGHFIPILHNESNTPENYAYLKLSIFILFLDDVLLTYEIAIKLFNKQIAFYAGLFYLLNFSIRKKHSTLGMFSFSFNNLLHYRITFRYTFS